MSEYGTDRGDMRGSLMSRWQVPLLVMGIGLFGAGLGLNWVKGRGEAGDKYAIYFDEVAKQNMAGQHKTAKAMLDEVAPYTDELDAALERRFQVLVGDTVYLGQNSRGWEAVRDPERVIEAYQMARSMGEALDDERIRRLAESLAETGRDGEALALLDDLGAAGSDARVAMLRSLIETSMARSPIEVARAEGLIDRLLGEDGLVEEVEAWATARRAEIAVRDGRASAAISLLLRRLARMRGGLAGGDGGGAAVAGRDPAGAELMTMLARAYLAEGDVGEAERWFDSARNVLTSEDELLADVWMGLGKIRFDEDNVLEALEYFSRVVERYPTSDVYAEALVSKAEAESRRGAPDVAVADYRAAIRLVERRVDPSGRLRERLIESLGAEYDLRFGQGDYGRAGEYLSLESELYAGAVPTDLLRRRAVNEEMLAFDTMGITEVGDPAAIDWERIDPTLRREAGRYFRTAAEAYSSYAAALEGMRDGEAYSDALWRAADYFDRAGLVARAIDTFQRFINEHPNEPKRLEATFRLAQTYQSDRQLTRAAELYEDLIENEPRTPEAYASLIPLARTYLDMGSDFTGRAEQVLKSVVEDHPALRPESPEYREALADLGDLYYRRGGAGDFELAIASLDELLRRERDDPVVTAGLGGIDLLSARFQLADAYRKSARQIARRLEGAMPPGERDTLSGERANRLGEARRRFGEVIDGLEAERGERLSDLQKLDLRNSYFFRADCAYELRQYEGTDGSIALYERASNRYASEPAGLVALVGMVNSYSQLAQMDERYWQEAKQANQRAKVYLNQIPEEAFDDPTLPMDRVHWQRWLDSMDDMAEALVGPVTGP